MKIFNRLKMWSSLTLILCLATQLQAADVDLATAQNAAKSFMAKQVTNGRLKAAAISNLKLVKAEASVAKPEAVDYYIFNADKAYVVVAGDDQAPEILMYGEEGNVNLDRIPPAMQWLLNKYKYQIDGLKAGTLKSNGYTPKATTAVAPLVNANWDQGEPYWNHTPTSGSTHAYTGCPATSLSMCFYLYKWPKTYPALPKVSVSGGLTAAALSEKAADWDNIIDEYTGPTNYSYTSAQAEAVSWLMRYVGQACNMQYTTSGSGAYDDEIHQACLTFGYTDAQLLTLTDSYAGYNQNYTDSQWNEWMLAELHAGRPIEYLASDPSAGGHAFNVFGCDTSGKYYVNWGWSGEDNGYCTLHNFTTGNNSTGQGGGSYTFNYGEAMIIGIAPPASALGPTITVNPTSLEFEGYVGDTYTKTFTVTGTNLEGNITISKQGSSYFTVSTTSITAANAANGVQVTVTYKPTTTGTTNAILTLTSSNAESVTFNVRGTAQEKVPTITVDPTSLSFSANLSSTVTKTINVTGLFLTNNVTVTLNDNNGVFGVTPTTITAANAANGVPVTVTFSSANEGNFTGSLTFASNGAETKTVQLTAQANDGGTASDPYLNIAKYESINEAGATVSGMSAISKYTEYPDDACAWLTMSNYGAMKADAAQNWYATSSLSQYNNSWDASDIFPGDDAYFGSSQAYSIYGSGNQTYYVTNCSQVKALVKDGSSYKATLSIYECTLNADGSITASTTAVDSQQGGASGTAVITSATLDASKIYKVQLAGGGSYPDLLEIGFKTPIQGVETPVAADATDITANGFKAHWNACEGATSYTLRVMPKPETPAYTLLLTEGFSNCTTDGATDVGSNNTLNNYMDNAGWTGSKLYTAVGGIRLGTGSAKGTLTSPALDLTNSNGKVSVKFKAKAYGTDTSCGMTISCGSSSTTVTIPSSTEAEYTQVLDCSAASGQNLAFATTANRKRVIITSIEIYSGDISTVAAAPALKAEEEIIIPNITNTEYNVADLEPETTYIYDVKAVYGDKESNWSNQIEVTTLETHVDINKPVATEATDIDKASFTANWDPCEGATSYTLRVQPKPIMELLLSEKFSKFTAEGNTNIGNNLDNYMDNAGWFGSEVYTSINGILFGTSSASGYLISPSFSLPANSEKISVKFKAKSYGSDTGCGLQLSSAASNTTVAIGSTEEEYTVVFDCTTNLTESQIIFATTKSSYGRVVMTDLEIYSGDITDEDAKSCLKEVILDGDMITVNGITSTSYTVTELATNTTYIYDVKAIYGDQESDWSNQISVTTLKDDVTPLDFILENGVDGEEYTISNNLAVVDVAEYADYAFLTDGKDNWICVTATESSKFQPFINNGFIEGGTITGVLSGMGLNPLMTVNSVAVGSEDEIDFDIVTYHLSDTFNPKVNQVIDVIGYWNATDGALRAYEPGHGAQGQSMTLDYTWGASENTLQNGKKYTVRCGMNIKEPWKTTDGLRPRDYDYDFQNYIGRAMRLPSAPTAIGTIDLDGYNSTVNVYNVQGQLIRKDIKASEATKGLARGIYIVGNKKVVVK